MVDISNHHPSLPVQVNRTTNGAIIQLISIASHPEALLYQVVEISRIELYFLSHLRMHSASLPPEQATRSSPSQTTRGSCCNLLLFRRHGNPTMPRIALTEIFVHLCRSRLFPVLSRRLKVIRFRLHSSNLRPASPCCLFRIRNSSSATPGISIQLKTTIIRLHPSSHPSALRSTHDPACISSHLHFRSSSLGISQHLNVKYIRLHPVNQPSPMTRLFYAINAAFKVLWMPFRSAGSTPVCIVYDSTPPVVKLHHHVSTSSC